MSNTEADVGTRPDLVFCPFSMDYLPAILQKEVQFIAIEGHTGGVNQGCAHISADDHGLQKLSLAQNGHLPNEMFQKI